MFNYYKKGDKVIYTSKHIGTVIKDPEPLPHGNGYGVLVEWDDQNLIPPQMVIERDYLDFYNLPVGYGALNNNSDLCPQCGEVWTKTTVIHETYYDCLKCNMKKEDIENNFQNKNGGGV